MKKGKNGSIRTKLIASLVGMSVAISLLCGGALAMVLYLTSMNAMEDRVAESASAYNIAVRRAIEVFETRIEAIAKNPEVTDASAGKDAQKKTFAELAEKYGFLDLNLLDAKGIDGDGRDLSSREYFIKAMEGETNISSTLVSSKDGSVVLILCAKVDNGTGYNGCVFALLPSDTFSTMIDNVKIGETGYGFVVDRDGVIIAHRDRALVNEFANYITLSESDKAYAEMAGVVDSMTAGETGSRQLRFEDKALYVGYSPIEGTDGWSMGAAASVDELLEGFYEGITITVVMTLIFIVLSVLVGVLIANPIAKPIIALVKRVEGLAQGDLHTPVPQVRTKGEVAVLADSFTTTVDTLRDYVGEISRVLGSLAEGDCTVSAVQDYRGDFSSIRDSLNKIAQGLNQIFRAVNRSTDQVATGSTQVSMSAQALAQGATEQATAVEELSASVVSIRGDVERSAQSAEDVKRLSKRALEEVAAGDAQTRRMVESMREISGTSSRIGKIIKTIDDIAFQTNILALNAAVEAARAGSSGKGFAVVAEEVRSLAGKSADAAKNTSELINNSLRAVEKGEGMAQETANALSAILSTVEQTASLIEQISDATKDQAAAIRQITSGVEQISEVVQQNSATSEESAAASEEMSAQANAMRETLAFLKLRDEDGAPAQRYNVQAAPDRPALPELALRR